MIIGDSKVLFRPIIILSHPQMGENIGAAARAMSNFGLTQLRLVKPRDGWPNSKAFDVAANGVNILEEATIHQDLISAVNDIEVLYGSASTSRNIDKKIINPWQLRASKNKVGILFGCERSGLNNDELALCNEIIQIPTMNNPSLNLGQAVNIIAYEYHKLLLNHKSTTQKIFNPIANKADISNMINFLEKNLDETKFFKSPKMKPTMIRNLTMLFIKAKLTQQDVKSLYGIFKSLGKA